MGNEKKKKVLWRTVQTLLLIAGILLLFVGISLIFMAPRIIDGKIRESKTLVEDSELYRLWKDPDYKYDSYVYVYSVKNPDQIINGSKPEVVKIGPYAYKIYQKKNVLGFGNDTIRYETALIFAFDKNASCEECSLRRKIWIPNIVFQKFVEVASNPATSLAQSALTSQTPFLEVSVENILFKGYKDPYLEDVCTIPLLDFICESVLDLPEKIGLMTKRNGTDRKVFEASTGQFDGGASVGKIVSWDGQKLLPQNWWNSREAREINGTDGAVYRPFIKKSDTLYVFVPVLCRSIHLTFAEEFVYKDIVAYRFTAKEDLLDPALPGNEGFCHNSGKAFFSEHEKCLPKGLLDLSHCYQGSPPIVFSFPNFLYTDPVVKESVIGFNESSVARDGIVVELEPRSGTLLRVYRRSQINIAMWKGRGITFGLCLYHFPINMNIYAFGLSANLSKMRNSIVPVLAEYQIVEIGDGSLAILQKTLINAERAAAFLSFLFILLGAVLVTAALISELLFRTPLLKRTMIDNSEKAVTHIAVQPVSSDQKNVAFRPGTS